MEFFVSLLLFANEIKHLKKTGNNILFLSSLARSLFTVTLSSFLTLVQFSRF